MKHYVSNTVVCPFYTQEQPLKIHCEGFTKDNSIQVSFPDSFKKDKHMKRHCKNIQCYSSCPIYLANELQYKEDDL